MKQVHRHLRIAARAVAHPTPEARSRVRASFVLWTYVAFLVASVGAVGAILVVRGHALDIRWLVPLALLGLVAERWSVRLTRTTEVSISLLPALFAAVVFGPLQAMAVGAASMLGDFRAPYLRSVVYTSTNALTAATAGIVAAAAGHLASSELGAVAIAAISAVLVGTLVDGLLCALTSWIRGNSPRQLIRDVLPVLPTTLLLYGAVVTCLSYAYVALSPWSVVLFLLPALAAQRLFTMYQAQRELASDLVVVNSQLERANLSFASALVTTLDARDRYTAGHSAAVAVYARDIAAELGLPEETQQLAHLAGLLHDIGKIGVQAGILEKPGPLTLAERRKMEEHSETGERILANVEAYSEIAHVVRHHHERIDGRGYPDGIEGDTIPLISRIICVADAYNAMTSDRPYRDAMPPDIARARLLQAAGTQFDSDVVRAFDELLEGAAETYATGATAAFALEAQAHPELAAAAA